MSDPNFPNTLAAVLQEALLRIDPAPGLTWKKMFGGAGYYADGVIFAAYFGTDSLALKLSEDDRAALLTVPGSAPSEMSKQYTEIPPSMVHDVEAIAPWVEKAVRYVKGLPPQKPRTRRKRGELLP